MDRLAEAGNAGLGGVIEKGSTKAVDPTTVEFTLLGANGNFPYLVSVFNAQSLITPAAYATGTTLDGMPDGTGPWKLDSYDQSTGAKYSRSDTWWGGTTPLDTVEFTFFDEPGPMVTAYQGDQIDAINQFDVNSGAILFDDPNFNALRAQTTNHRQIWMRCDTGQFTDKRVRQALALSLDREAMVQQLFKGQGQVANDHVIFSLYPYFDPSVPQRTRDVEKAKQLLADAGATGLKATLHAAVLQEVPDLAVLIQSNAKEAGIELTPAVEELGTFYGAQWCPGRARGSALLRRRRTRHRGLRPPRFAGRLPQLGLPDEGRLELVAVRVPGIRRRVRRLPDGRRRRRAEGRRQQDRDDHARGHPRRDRVHVRLPVRVLEEVPGRLLERARADVLPDGVKGLTEGHKRGRLAAAPAPPSTR